MTTVATSSEPEGRPASQTLDRGLRTLEVVAESPHPMTVADVAAHLGLHRSIAYRMLRTLEAHTLLERDGDGRFSAGPGLAVLARRVYPTLQASARPELSQLADEVGMTAFLVTRQADEAVTVVVVEPRDSQAHVAYRPGTRHRVDRGAPGLALLAGSAPLDGERAEVSAGRVRGWVASRAEVLPGMSSVAAPVLDRHGTCRGAVAVVFVAERELDPLGEAVSRAARAVGRQL